MIQDGFDYGDGYEKATEPGADVQVLQRDSIHGGFGWHKRSEYKRTEPLDGVSKYRKPIKPKDKKMDENEPKVEITNKTGRIVLLLDDAIKIGEDAKIKKAEIAKREEIGPGDWFICGGNRIFKCEHARDVIVIAAYGGFHCIKSECKKLHPNLEVRAWLDKTIGGEG
jgi:hypothetical protein